MKMKADDAGNYIVAGVPSFARLGQKLMGSNVVQWPMSHCLPLHVVLKPEGAQHPDFNMTFNVATSYKMTA